MSGKVLTVKYLKQNEKKIKTFFSYDGLKIVIYYEYIQ